MATADPSLHRAATDHEAHAVALLTHFSPYAVRRLALDTEGEAIGPI